MLPTYPESTRRELARNLLQNVLQIKRGENLLIETWSSTLPWAASLVLEARMVGARPLLLVEDEATFWQSVKEAPAANVGQVGSHDWAALKESDAHVYFYGPLETTLEDALPRSILARMNAGDHEWFRLIEKYGVRSVRWDLGRTSDRWAKKYGVGLAEWRRELIDASLVDPRAMQRSGARIGGALRRGREVHITHPNGTDLTLRLAGRRPSVHDGVIDASDVRAGDVWTVVPSGVVTVAVDETFAEGTFVPDITGVMFVRGVEEPLAPGSWTFRKGHLTGFSHRTGDERFRRAYKALGPGKDRPGLLSIGLNAKISSIPLLFDQEQGVVTLAIGRNSHQGGSTQTPRFTAYRSLRGASVEVDGERIVDGGHLD